MILALQILVAPMAVVIRLPNKAIKRENLQLAVFTAFNNFSQLQISPYWGVGIFLNI